MAHQLKMVGVIDWERIAALALRNRLPSMFHEAAGGDRWSRASRRDCFSWSIAELPTILVRADEVIE
jgi:hypothetical protein